MLQGRVCGPSLGGLRLLKSPLAVPKTFSDYGPVTAKQGSRGG